MAIIGLIAAGSSVDNMAMTVAIATRPPIMGRYRTR